MSQQLAFHKYGPLLSSSFLFSSSFCSMGMRARGVEYRERPCLPSTSRFFSGRRFPLATDSSIDVHRFFFCSPFRASVSPEPEVYMDMRSVPPAMAALQDDDGVPLVSVPAEGREFSCRV